MTIFTFTVRAYDTGKYIKNPWQANSTFAKYKPEGSSWYAYDVELLSKTRANFIVYDIACTVYGGIGRVSYEFSCDVDERDTSNFIEREVRRIAVRQENLEFESVRLARVLTIESEIMSGL